MKQEYGFENPEISYLKRFFNQESIVPGPSGQILEIKLPNLDEDESAKLIKTLEKIGVILSITSYRDGKFEFALTHPEAIATMLEKVIVKSEPTDHAEPVPSEKVGSEWSSEQLDKAEEAYQSRRAEQVDSESYEPYTEDALDAIERGAILFHQGLTEDEVLDTTRTHNPKFATDRKLFPQEFRWEGKALFHKDGTPVSVIEHRKILEDAKTSPEALATACKIHEGLVRWVVDVYNKKFARNADHLLEIDDLLQAGRIGLIKAIRKVDLSDDETHIPTSYFIEYIEKSMLNAVYRDKGGKAIKLPPNISPDSKKFRNDVDRQREDHDFAEPDLMELAENTDIPIGKVRDLYQVIQQIPESYDDENPEHQQDYYRPDLHRHEDDPLFRDQIENYTEKNRTEMLNQVLQSLNPRLERIIRLRFFHDKSLQEIADDMGVTSTRVSQLEIKALRILKHPGRAKLLRSLLGSEPIRKYRPDDLW